MSTRNAASGGRSIAIRQASIMSASDTDASISSASSAGHCTAQERRWSSAMLGDSSGQARRTDAAIGSPEAAPTGAIVSGCVGLLRSPSSLCPLARRLRRIRRTSGPGQLDLDAFRRLLLQIGGANIAGADRVWLPPTSSSLWDEQRVPSLLLRHGGARSVFDCSTRCARFARIALGTRLLRRHLQTMKRVCSLLLSTAERDPGCSLSSRGCH
jgi:hypothetical protein